MLELCCCICRLWRCDYWELELWISLSYYWLLTSFSWEIARCCCCCFLMMLRKSCLSSVLLSLRPWSIWPGISMLIIAPLSYIHITVFCAYFCPSQAPCSPSSHSSPSWESSLSGASHQLSALSLALVHYHSFTTIILTSTLHRPLPHTHLLLQISPQTPSLSWISSCQLAVPPSLASSIALASASSPCYSAAQHNWGGVSQSVWGIVF